jgi:hypothetical protein
MKTERRKFKIYQFLRKVVPDDWDLTEIDQSILLDYNRDNVGSKPRSAAWVSVKNPDRWNMSEGSTKKQERVVRKLALLWERYNEREVTLTFPPVELGKEYDIYRKDDKDNDD